MPLHTSALFPDHLIFRAEEEICYHEDKHSAGGLSQKKDIEIRYANDFFCVDLLFSKNVTNVPIIAPDLSVGARLHQFLEKWAALAVSPKVLTVLKEGYTLPFWFRPNLTRSRPIKSCYVNPHRNHNLFEALNHLKNKNVVGPVTTPQGFYNRLFLVPNPNNC